MLTLMQRSVLLGAAWTGSAAAAVGLGFLAVSLVDASASPSPRPPAATGATPASSTVSATGEQATVAGTVYASCIVGAAPDLASAPASGWSVDDSSAPGQVEFRSGTQKVEVRVTCVDGQPRFSVEAGSSAAPSSTVGSGGVDDSGGGHGSDDPAGDDSSGRGGGGHGSDG